MIQNEAIRQEVIELLKGNITGIENFHNGRAVFTDVDAELPAIAVFIDEAEYRPVTACGNECDAIVKVEIYLPLFSTESDLDMFAESIAKVMEQAEFKSMDGCLLHRYTYDYDANESAWKLSTLHFLVNYLN